MLVLIIAKYQLQQGLFYYGTMLRKWTQVR